MEKVETWYRKLLAYSLLIGVVGGAGALTFTLVTQGGSSLLFGDMSPETWSGSLYWIPLTSFGALLVTYLRKKMKVPKEVPGAVQLAKSGWVEPSGSLKLILIGVLTIIFGASLGPSFGIVIIGGAFASWLVTKVGPDLNRDQQKEYSQTGMAGSLGAVFSAPVLATLLTMELSASKLGYMVSVLPRLIASALGYIVFFGITGTVLIKAYELPDYNYDNYHLLLGALLGIAAVLFLMIFAVISKATSYILNLVKNNYIKAIIGGAAIGFITFALPLTFGSGNSQLSEVTSSYTVFSIGMLIVLLVAKTVAIKLSQDSGFIGGNVFPLLFYSGLAGILIHAIFPGVPVALAVGAMMASLPGAALTAPISLILIAVGGIGLSPEAIPPITMAVVVAQLSMVFIKNLVLEKSEQ